MRRSSWGRLVCAGACANVGGVEQKPRYAFRRGAVELTRRRWSLLGGILVAGIVAATVLIATVSPAAGAIALGVTAVAGALTIGVGRSSQSGN